MSDFTPIKIARFFTHERSTKNTERYREEPGSENDATAVGILYIQRSAFNGAKIPESLTMTIEYNDHA